MFEAHTATCRKPKAGKRSTGDRLAAALMALCDYRGQILVHSEAPWASITFAGTRHRLELLFAGPEDVEAGEHLIAALPDHEFTIPRQLVADATIRSVEHRMHPAPRLSVECEILMLEES